tara:strand:+ start:1823 stop:3247 length:1425 start_codon:yes stop_codon:yes gene_type:complete
MDVEKIIKQLGGAKAVQELLGVSQSAVSNYKIRGKFPDYAIPIIWNSINSDENKIKFDQILEKRNEENKKSTFNIILIISGGIAAYKIPDIIRKIKEKGYKVIPVLTNGGAEFIKPLTLSSLAEEKCYTNLFDLTSESEMGHIKLARSADLIIVAPASANFIAKISSGICDDLASTIILATKSPIIVCPAMNPYMWSNKATQENILKLKDRQFKILDPEDGLSACGEIGVGRLANNQRILNQITSIANKTNSHKPLEGIKVLVTAGPTIEPIDDVRFISNRSSGKQGYSIVESLSENGADVSLITGPVSLPSPSANKVINVTTAEEMLNVTLKLLPVDVAICVAAVSDWKIENKFNGKLKKNNKEVILKLVQNPDILKTLSKHKNRPKLLIGFAAETENLSQLTNQKFKSKGCDWILGNIVGQNTSTFGGEENSILFKTNKSEESWPTMTKAAVANRLVNEIINELGTNYVNQI